MDPDQDSPIARAGRTFMTFWNYLTETVSRLLRQEPPATEINDANITQDATDSNELDPGHTNSGTAQESEGEPQHVAPASSLSLSRPLVSWDTGSELEIDNIQEEKCKGESMIEEEVETAMEDNKEEHLKLYAENLVLKLIEDVNNRLYPGESLNVDIEEAKQSSHAVQERNRPIVQQHSIDQMNEKYIKLREDEDHHAITILKQNNEKIILENQNIAVTQSDQCLDKTPSLNFSETLPHSESKMFEDNRSIGSEGEPIINKQEHTMEDSIVESANNNTEEDKKEKPGNEMEQNIVEGYNARDESVDIFLKHMAYNIPSDDTTSLFLGAMSVKSDLDDKDEGISDGDDDELVLSNEQEEIFMEKLCLGAPATVKQNESPTEEEALKNTPPAKCEGQDFVSRELYSSYKESQQGVPEHNNESDGSATQKFLKVGNCMEVQTTLLQEEAGSGEARRLQNSGSEAKGDSLDKTELMEKEDTIDSFEVDIAGTKPILLHNDMKTVVEDLVEELEASFVLKDDAQEKEEILVEIDGGEDFSETEDVDGGETSKMIGCTKGDLAKTLPQMSIETEGESLTVNMQYTGTDLKDMGGDVCALEKETTEPMTTNESEVQLGITVDDAKTVSHEDESLDVANNDISESMEPAEGSMKDAFQYTYMLEKLTEPLCTEVIDDEILDLWIQQTSMDNTDVKREDHGQEEKQSETLDDEKVESILDQGVVCDADVLLSTTIESGFFDQPLDLWASHECKEQELPKIEQSPNINTTVMSESEDASEFSIKSEFEMPWKEDLLNKDLRQGLETSPECTDDDEAETLQNPDAVVPMPSPEINSKVAVDADNTPLTKMRTLFEVEVMSNNQQEPSNESQNIIQNTVSMSDTLAEDYQLPLQEKPKEDIIPGFKIEDDNIYKIDATDLDFTPQKSRIAVKNPRARPPTDPRLLLHKPSLEPSPSKTSIIPPGVPLGVKLPGLGAGFPVLKLTKKAVEDETETQETKSEDDADVAKKEDSQHKPRWMPPGRPGFGNPLMSELKSKLKRTKE